MNRVPVGRAPGSIHYWVGLISLEHIYGDRTQWLTERPFDTVQIVRLDLPLEDSAKAGSAAFTYELNRRKQSLNLVRIAVRIPCNGWRGEQGIAVEYVRQ